MPISHRSGIITIPLVSLPNGVTLQAIDGETMTSPTTMSNNYYSRNGFTFATPSNPSYPGTDWDSPSFLPFGCFFGLFPGDMSIMLDLGLNVTSATTSDASPSAMVTNHVQGFNGWDPAIPNTDGPAMGDWTPCYHIDEPSSPSDIQRPMANTDGLASLTAPNQAGRMWDVAFTINQMVGGDLGGSPMKTVLSLNNFNRVGGGLRSIDIAGMDIYWFAGAGDTVVSPSLAGVLQQPMLFTSTATTAQMKRGSHYGNMIDVFRSWTNGTNSTNGDGMIGTSGATGRIPLRVYIENHNGNFNEASDLILPPELNWAVWSTLIHGARMIDYFVYSGIESGGGITSQGFATNIISGQSISIYDQAKATNAFVLSLAPVINSPFALGYATVSPSGYVFPTPASSWLNGGVEFCVKWYQGKFYILATTREPETTTNLSATFTLISTAVGSTATVINESRTISISGHQFTDTFANAWTVHIYRIDP